jgi:hypothetical protein
VAFVRPRRSCCQVCTVSRPFDFSILNNVSAGGDYLSIMASVEGLFDDPSAQSPPALNLDKLASVSSSIDWSGSVLRSVSSGERNRRDSFVCVRFQDQDPDLEDESDLSMYTDSDLHDPTKVIDWPCQVQSFVRVTVEVEGAGADINGSANDPISDIDFLKAFVAPDRDQRPAKRRRAGPGQPQSLRLDLAKVRWYKAARPSSAQSANEHFRLWLDEFESESSQNGRLQYIPVQRLYRPFFHVYEHGEELQGRVRKFHVAPLDIPVGV